ncbi:AI-2E family transporter [Phenylobacterium sp. LjRoot225]|uniref:AI-2E family transporter n=1 Tax=Phenylobacterium sp. LjRoot225 TaxID=3342285 RepID=UPI003ECFDAD7
MAAAVSSSAVTRNATVLLAVIATGATLYWLAHILTPLALAMFLAVMIDGFARVLAHRLPGVSRRAALPLAVVLSLAIFGGSAFFIAENATNFGGQLVGYTPKLNSLIAQGANMLGIHAPVSISTLAQQLDPAKYLGIVARGLQNFTATAGFVLVYAAFIIASRGNFERKMVSLFRSREERQEAVAAFLRIRDGVERYLWVQTITGLMIAAGSWIAMTAVGLNDAAFWAFLIFIVSYIPVIGGLLGILAPPVFALLQFDTIWQAIVLFAVLNTIGVVVGNVIYPRMQGRSLNIDPVVVLLALAFWGAIWGVVGAFLSTPLTVMAMVILAQFEGTRWIAIMLSADGAPHQLREAKPGAPPD